MLPLGRVGAGADVGSVVQSQGQPLQKPVAPADKQTAPQPDIP
jgi:hypothetical protein